MQDKPLNLVEFKLEDALQKERIKRTLDQLKKEGDIDRLHETAFYLLHLWHMQKAMTNYFQKEAVENLGTRHREDCSGWS